ncbi:MAG TPA: YdeI/OmpD-associated family protein [Candidatus Acidoferrales bacterium]|jgi:uncharacterized protein YdeI (YjbR/CyaY-like superfamily)|nr:YdeI/OmpD-associated family protein [Candidatus Acidoferrales bacterium]
MKPTFFESPSKLRVWLEKHHARETELWVGFHKKGSGKPSITWPEAVDALLCFGWIDGIRKSLDETSYTIRVTPRKAKSKWSAINVKRIQELDKLGLVHARGLEAFEARTAENTYSYEQRTVAKLGRRFEKQFRANKTAWDFFRSQAPSYQRTATWWVISAKKEETKIKRLERLIEDSARGQSIAPLRRSAISK